MSNTTTTAQSQTNNQEETKMSNTTTTAVQNQTAPNGETKLEQYAKLVADTTQQTDSDLAGIIDSIFNIVEASGKASMQEINQFSERGLPIHVWLQKSLGKTSGEITKMVREGKIGTKELDKAITDNLTELLAETPTLETSIIESSGDLRQISTLFSVKASIPGEEWDFDFEYANFEDGQTGEIHFGTYTAQDFEIELFTDVEAYLQEVHGAQLTN